MYGLGKEWGGGQARGRGKKNVRLNDDIHYRVELAVCVCRYTSYKTREHAEKCYITVFWTRIFTNVMD